MSGPLEKPGMYVLEDGLMGYGAGLGAHENGDPLLILSVEVLDNGTKFVHIVRLKYSERVPADQVVHYKKPLNANGGVFP